MAGFAASTIYWARFSFVPHSLRWYLRRDKYYTILFRKQERTHFLVWYHAYAPSPSSHDHRVNYLPCVPITSSTGLSLVVCGVQGYSILPLRVNGLPFSSSATSVMGCADMVPLVMDTMYLFFTVHPLAGLWSLLLITALRPAKFLNLTAT